ncbi:MAG TPA: pectinesterase family protein [Ruminiclostridium sp.]|nr:pectinesterase family protein [Ruminiclostridium sp.]
MVLFILAQTLTNPGIMSNVKAVSYDIVVAKDGSGNYTTVQAAINSVPSNNQTRTTIYVKNGTYKEKINISSSKINISLIGQSRTGTILTYNDSASTKTSSGGTMGTTGSASVTIAGDGFQAEGITFENSYDEAANGSSQAVAMLAKADKMVFKDCAFKGNQDTLYANGDGRRQYYCNCYIEGDVDFIFGSANAVFDSCEIFSLNRSGGCVTAPSTKAAQKGYLIYKCRLTSSSQPKTIYLGRPWIPSSNPGEITPKVLFRECEIGAHITSAGWTVMSGNDPANYEMWEYMNTGAGANTSRKQLPASKAADYTREKFLAGSDGWNPVSNNNVPQIPDGQYIKSLIVNDAENAADWSIQSSLKVGDTVYGDRTFKFTQIPQMLLDSEWIRTACDSKMYTTDEAVFTAKSDISVYVGLDTRVASIPAWLNGWTNTGETMASDNSVAYNLYKKDFAANSTVLLGTNGASSSTVNYTVVVAPKTPDTLTGDVNADGAVNALDFALLKKYLLSGVSDGMNLTAADLNKDGSVNAIDLALLKSYLLGMISGF